MVLDFFLVFFFLQEIKAKRDALLEQGVLLKAQSKAHFNTSNLK